MNGSGILHRLGSRFGWRNESSLRESIAELMQEAAEPPPPGEAPELDGQERALIANVLRLRDTSANDVMVPRADIVAIRADSTLEAALALIRLEGHSRLPVYRDQLDEIVGMVHIKDVFGYVGKPDEFRLEEILRQPLLVAPQMPVLDLLFQMRQAHMHLALVVDEYGGIDGLVTIEDLVETIVGDIADEHDEAEPTLISERPDGAFDVDARLPIAALEEKLGPVLTAEERAADLDTAGGLVVTLAGRVPARGEVVRHPAGWDFRVLDADARRVRRLRVRPVPAQAA
ncbi:MAG: hemolysin family protein [Acetobacteraceae bacterium]